jgi:hypothetical protein
METFLSLQTGIDAHQESYPMGTGENNFPKDKAAGALTWLLSSIWCPGFKSICLYRLSPFPVSLLGAEALEHFHLALRKLTLLPTSQNVICKIRFSIATLRVIRLHLARTAKSQAYNCPAWPPLIRYIGSEFARIKQYLILQGRSWYEGA